MVGSEWQAVAPVIKMKANFWSNWSDIAVDHARIARRERGVLVDWWSRGDTTAHPMVAEMNASLVAIAATAFAIDAFHADVAPLLGRNPDARVARGKTRAYVLDTFRQGVPEAKTWQKEFDWLFRTRDAEVHPISEFAPPVPHPAVASNVSVEVVRYSVEGSDRAVDILVRVWRGLFEGRTVEELRPWTLEREHVFRAFLESVDAVSNQPVA